MAVLHKLQTGLDVNVKFTGVRVFEYTPECIVFDLLDIPLYHGWLVDPQVSILIHNLEKQVPLKHLLSPHDVIMIISVSQIHDMHCAVSSFNFLKSKNEIYNKIITYK